jgi:hypothetical protein
MLRDSREAAGPPQIRIQDGFIRRRNGFAVVNLYSSADCRRCSLKPFRNCYANVSSDRFAGRSATVVIARFLFQDSNRPIVHRVRILA